MWKFQFFFFLYLKKEKVIILLQYRVDFLFVFSIVFWISWFLHIANLRKLILLKSWVLYNFVRKKNHDIYILYMYMFSIIIIINEYYQFKYCVCLYIDIHEYIYLLLM